jgi:hypothetical protein
MRLRRGAVNSSLTPISQTYSQWHIGIKNPISKHYKIIEATKKWFAVYGFLISVNPDNFWITPCAPI